MNNPRPHVSRVLPYFQVASISLNIAQAIVYFHHHVTDQHSRKLVKMTGQYRLTSNDVAVLNGGGHVVFTDKDGTSHSVSL